MYKKKWVNKRTVLAMLVFSMMIFNLSSTLVSGHKNCPSGRSNERFPGAYAFIDHKRGSKNYNSYGPHDWIADSAVRLILLNPTYKNYVNWLFPEHSSVAGSCAVDLANLPIQMIEGERGKKYYSWFANYENWDEITWKKVRRYASFLYGTGTPDRTFSTAKKISVRDPWAPPEENQEAKPVRWIGTESSKYHHILFDFEDGNGKLIKTKKGAATMADKAGDDARTLLSRDAEVEENGQQKERDGKFETAALALGAMVHYIGDVSHPCHVSSKKNLNHNPWDVYCAKICGLDEEGNGKPNWAHCNPVNLSEWLTDEVKPEECAIAMAEDNFAGIDIYGKMEENNWNNRSLASGNPDFPLGSTDDVSAQKRVKDLMCRAAYYSACAMLYIIQKAGWHDKSDDDVDYPADGAITATGVITDPVDERATSEDLKSEEDEESVDTSSLFNEIEEHHFNSQMWLVLSITGIATVVIPWLIQERIRSRAGAKTPAAS